MPHITINAQTHTLAEQTTLSNLLQKQGYTDMLVAVAINGAFLPKACHDTHIINNGDDIEIVAPMQGG